MTRIAPKARADLPSDLQPLWDRMAAYGAFENQAGVLAYRPAIFQHVWQMLTRLSDEAVLPKRALELCLVTVSLLNRCTYCVAHHAPKLAVEGLSPEGTEHLLDYANHPELDDVDRLVVEYAIAVTLDWTRIGDSLFDRLRAHFSDEQIVEMTWRTALCGAFNRFNDILQLDIEPAVPRRDAAE